jgi:hypothetical protein
VKGNQNSGCWRMVEGICELGMGQWEHQNRNKHHNDNENVFNNENHY